MKRTLFGMISAGALLLALSYSHPAEAQSIATPADCAAFSPQQQWPSGYATYCAGATSADAQTMQGGIAQINGNGIFAMQKAEVEFFIYGTPAQYQADFPASSGYPTPLSTDFGVTYFDGNNNPIFSAIFKTNGAGKPNTYINNTSAFQSSRSLDALFGYVNDGGVILSPNPNLSAITTTGSGVNPGYAQSNFSDELTIDWKTFNATNACYSSTLGNGLFTGQQDPRNNAYICNGTLGTGTALNAAYASKTNEAIVQLIWPTPFVTFAQLQAEINAAVVQGQPNNAALSPDHYLLFAGQFPCLGSTNNPYQYLASVTRNGILPTSSVNKCEVSVYPPPIFPISTAAVQLFDESWVNYPGMGYVFDGTIAGGVPSDGVATSLQQTLDRMGSLNGQGANPPAIQGKLKAARAYIYVVKNTANHAALFANAGQQTDQTGTTYDAVTYPNGNLYYVVLNEQNIQGKSNTLTQNYVNEVAAHELGHVIEDTNGFDSSTAPFELAMQHDFLTMDFVNGNLSTPRQPCTNYADLTAPLANIIDIGTSQPFCTGTTLEPKWVGKSAGQILEGVYAGTPAEKGLPATSGLFDKTLAAGTLGYNPGITLPIGRHEWFAQAFALVAGTLDTGGLGFAAYESMLPAGYFQCTAGTGNVYPNNLKGWLYWVYTGQPAVGNMPAACTSALPKGYVPLP